MPWAHEETDLTYEGIETLDACPSLPSLSIEETDLTYEGIETMSRGGHNRMSATVEETDLTYEGIETYLLSGSPVRLLGRRNRPDLRRD